MFGDLALGAAGGGEVADLFGNDLALDVVVERDVFEVLALGGEADEAELEEVGLLLDAVDTDVVCAVGHHGVARLDVF